MTRMLTAFVAASLLAAQCLPRPALAENQMGYQLLSPQEAASLPRNHGSLGLNVERAQQITDGGMTFDIIRVTQVQRGATGAQAGLNAGDEIIAVNGQVFPSLATFAAYVGSSAPGSQLAVDYIPAGGGPQQAQRVRVTVGQAGRAGPAPPPDRRADTPASTGMSTGAKVAIGVGAVALLGCYEMGCFSHRPATASNGTRQQVQPRPEGPQQPSTFQPQPNGFQQQPNGFQPR